MPTHDPIRIIDTHTGGEPTRIVVAGGPPLGEGSLAERRGRFLEEFDHYRTAVLGEPRGCEVMVGALLVKSVDPNCAAGVIFFNNVGYLGMCGHGTLGVVAALEYFGNLKTGKHRLETPVGVVEVDYHGDGLTSFENVASYRQASNVGLKLKTGQTIRGDVAYGGNWFFLVGEEEHRQKLRLERADQLTGFCNLIRLALESEGVTGADGAEIDHVELFASTSDPEVNSRNFVLCPGGAYDRSPCGTGTSAKLACLAADGKLAEGETWVQESIVGSRFEGTYRRMGESIVPRITGTAHVNGESTLLIDDNDPFCWGIRS